MIKIKHYTANFNYFDSINTPEKAYWLGFIWADGYIAKRERVDKKGRTRTEYNLKISLKDTDSGHLQKFIDCIEGNYPILFYKNKGFGQTMTECRVFITNKHLGEVLYENYGIIPGRFNASKVLKVLPKELEKYFILGLFDGDGSFSAYSGSYGKKLNVGFGGSEQLLTFIEQHLTRKNVIKPCLNDSKSRKISQRHKNADGSWRQLKFAGKVQGMNILNYLYKNSPIYLDRKYQKYLDLPYHN